MVSSLSGDQTGKTIVAGGGIVHEVRLERGPALLPEADFSAHTMAEAVEKGLVMLPRDEGSPSLMRPARAYDKAARRSRRRPAFLILPAGVPGRSRAKHTRPHVL